MASRARLSIAKRKKNADTTQKGKTGRNEKRKRFSKVKLTRCPHCNEGQALFERNTFVFFKLPIKNSNNKTFTNEKR